MKLLGLLTYLDLNPFPLLGKGVPPWSEGAPFSSTPIARSTCDLKKPISVCKGAEYLFECPYELAHLFWPEFQIFECISVGRTKTSQHERWSEKIRPTLAGRTFYGHRTCSMAIEHALWPQNMFLDSRAYRTCYVAVEHVLWL